MSESSPSLQQDIVLSQPVNNLQEEADTGSAVAVDLNLVEWLKRKVSLTEYEASMWTEGSTAIAGEFFSNRSLTRLIIYIDEEFGLVLSVQQVPNLSQKVKKIQYFLKPNGEIDITPENVDRECQYGMIQGDTMDSLLHLMTGMFVPTFLSNGTWPESVRKDFSGQLHKFMACLTETTYELKGSTVLYLPAENIGDHDIAARDKDLVQRLENTLSHWDKQIKEVVSQQDYGQNDASGPLEEIAFWEDRTNDLGGIREQLDQPGVRNIVKVLELAKRYNQSPSRFLTDFLKLISPLYHNIHSPSPYPLINQETQNLQLLLISYLMHHPYL